MRLKGEESLGICYQGTVGGKVVNDILLDTGASKTLVKEELVDRDCMSGQTVPLRCAYGHVTSYPLALAGGRKGI